MNRVSVIIPCFREDPAQLRATLGVVRSILPEAELRVSDGANDPAIRDLCGTLSDTFYHQPPAATRAQAMNHAAAQASGNLLLFLHADTQLPKAAERLDTVRLERSPYGAFYKAFRPNHPMLRLHALAVNLWKAEIRKEFLGDNAIFVARDLFERIGGYRDLALFEDLDLSRRLACETGARATIIRSPVRTSSRQFEKLGVIRTLAFMHRCRRWYAEGLPTEEIALRYARLRTP